MVAEILWAFHLRGLAHIDPRGSRSQKRASMDGAPHPIDHAVVCEVSRCKQGVALPDWLKRPSEWLNDLGLLLNWTNDRSSRIERAAVAGNLAGEAAEWFARNGPLLSSVSSRLLTAPAPPQLLHTDARSDNLRWKSGRL